ncbi:50S ribosomal protein L18 [Desulfonauticus submarinus]|uniref:Large ribosomal subunit protein uL18 n=1 Tax=Desulfonauticus submarinus TaxID=206665 RepID=A0A1H0G4J3_9BACT|nr:50S ribosomal protein L18 [Desulfonauticus submarinus]SDO01833.1 LSU ribosomal protein L18P [Desulfonauticus submarinus]
MKRTRREARLKRKIRIRKKIYGTPERPRLVVFRSNRYIYAQVVDDTKGHTLVAYSSLAMGKKNVSKEVAKEVGLKIAELAKKAKIEKVVFDRNGYLYHGRVKALADGAREGGLKF